MRLKIITVAESNNILKKFLHWTNSAQSYGLNCIIAVVALIISGIYIHIGAAYFYLGMVHFAVIEWMVSAILILVGIWQLRIFAHKYEWRHPRS